MYIWRPTKEETMLETLIIIWLWGLLLITGALAVRAWLQWSHKVPQRYLDQREVRLREPELPPPRRIYPWELDDRR